MNENYDEYQIVTEVCNIGDLNIEDPTCKNVKKKGKTVAELIKESEEANRNINF